MYTYLQLYTVSCCRIVSEVSEVLEGRETVSVEDLEQLKYTEQVLVSIH